MKRFLSLLLAVLMVVSLVPMLALSVGAKGSDDAAFPELMITEVSANTANFNKLIQIWIGQIPAFEGFEIPKNKDEITDVFRYVEIYNAGDETVDLYDYKLAFDADAYGAGTNIVYTDLAAGIGENQAGGALLAPGECAVVWFRSANEIGAGLTVAQFKGYYEWQYSMANTAYTYALDLSSTPVLTVDLAVDGEGNLKNGFDLTTEGQVIYGIVADTVTDETDESRADTWISWVNWYAYLGIGANVFTKLTVTAGETDVTNGTTFIWNDKTLTYYMPSLENGCADENGKAVADVQYYTADLSKVTSADFHNNAEKSACHFLYGYDTSKPLCAGTPYAWSSTDQTPGLLNSVQSAVLPGPDVETDTPDLVISEVSPLPASNSLYEYIEIVNISDKAVNVYDYSVVQSSSFVNLRTQFFNKVNTLIPGDYGNIYAASPNSSYYDYNLSNPDYANGWLAPGEVALLWSCTNDVPNNKLRMQNFYGFYGLDESAVKVFAYDSNPTTGSVHTNLADYGFPMIGLAKNEKIGWTGDPYVSTPLMSAIKMPGGVATTINRGITIEDCESFVLSNAVLMANTTTATANGYAYQYTWNKHNGSANKMGVPIAMGKQMISYQGPTSYTFADPVIGDAWITSPASLTAAQKNDVTVPSDGARYVLYMQDYNQVKNSTDRNRILSTLGMSSVPADATEVAALAVADGKLTITNSGTAVDKLLVYANTLLADIAYTVEYKISYSDANGAVLTDAVVRVEVDELGTAAVYVNGLLSTDAQGAFVEVTEEGIVLTTNAGITAVYDSITIYTETDVSEAASCYYVGELATGEALYLAANVVGNEDLSNPRFTASEGSVTAAIGSETKLSFTASLDADYVDALESCFGEVNASMMVFRAADLGAVTDFTPDAFAAAGIAENSYTFEADKSLRNVGKNYRMSSSEVSMVENYYRDSYTAVGIISFETALGTVTLYSDYSDAITVTQVLASALQDTSDTRTAEYCYDLGDGTWARYTVEQMKAFAKICNQAI